MALIPLRTGRYMQVLTILSVLALIIFVVISRKINTYYTKSKIKVEIKSKIRKQCMIPYVDPYFTTMLEYINTGPPLVCKNESDKLVVSGTDPRVPCLVFHDNLTEIDDKEVKCYYGSLRRQNDFTATWAKRNKLLKRGVTLIKDEFVRVVCFSSSQKIFEEYFHFIQRKKEVERRRERIEELEGLNGAEKKLSVLFLVIDSVSRNHFLRQMKKTDGYLRQLSTMVDMKVFNKIGKVTIQIFFMLLLGRTWSEIQKKFRIDSNSTLDHLPFMWKNFAEAGYRILFAEDSGTFQAKTQGFAKVPTDYYFHPFLFAILNNLKTYVKLECLNSKPFADVILKWTQDFFDVFSPEPLFAFVKLAILSHDNLETVYQYDDPIYKFIKHMSVHHLNHSLVFFMSDHGPRHGAFRNTFHGRIESKLPFLFVLYPHWFSSKYPEMVSNLKNNANRLVTILDVHETAMDILRLNEKNPQSLRTPQGLFRVSLPANRTCEEARIPMQFCACDSRKVISVTDREVKDAAVILLKSINNFTENHRLNCASLKLKKILHATFEKAYTSYAIRSSYHYQLTIEVNPGGGMFEGTVWRFRFSDEYNVDPNVERVNKFGNQSSCIQDGFIKPYCYCYQ